MATIIIIPSKRPIVLKSIASKMNSKLVVGGIEPRMIKHETMTMAPKRAIEVRCIISRDNITYIDNKMRADIDNPVGISLPIKKGTAKIMTAKDAISRAAVRPFVGRFSLEAASKHLLMVDI
jgi:hypothetical protein